MITDGIRQVHIVNNIKFPTAYGNDDGIVLTRTLSGTTLKALLATGNNVAMQFMAGDRIVDALLTISTASGVVATINVGWNAAFSTVDVDGLLSAVDSNATSMKRVANGDSSTAALGGVLCTTDGGAVTIGASSTLVASDIVASLSVMYVKASPALT